jgi:hypothetical protein
MRIAVGIAVLAKHEEVSVKVTVNDAAGEGGGKERSAGIFDCF